MPVRLITYDLRQPGQDYTGLAEAIKQLGAWLHHPESVWLVNTAFSCEQVRSALSPHLTARDTLMVTTLSGSWATSGAPVVATGWLKQHLG